MCVPYICKLNLLFLVLGMFSVRIYFYCQKK